MLKFLIHRTGAMVTTMALVAVLIFALLHLAPGDPAAAAAGADADAARIAETRVRLGLDDSIFVQFWHWISSLLVGDLGTSYVQERSVLSIILDRLPVTASLVTLSIVVAVVISLVLGVVAAAHKGSLIDRLATMWASAGIALPDFFLGLMLVLMFSVWIPLFPTLGYVELGEDPIGWLTHFALPAVTLGVAVSAELTRHLRSSLIDVLDMDYIRTGRSKGLNEFTVVMKHGLRNASLPVMTVLGIEIARLLGATVIVEQLFALNGVGQLIVKAVFDRDIPIILGVGVFFSAVVLVINFLVDMSYGWLSPRVRT